MQCPVAKVAGVGGMTGWVGQLASHEWAKVLCSLVWSATMCRVALCGMVLQGLAWHGLVWGKVAYYAWGCGNAGGCMGRGEW